VKASRIQALAQQSTTVQRNLQQARGAFALRPQTSARQLVQARNQGDTVLADITDAETELSRELNAAEAETQQAQGALQQAQQAAAGDGAVAGTYTSSEVRAQQTLQAQAGSVATLERELAEAQRLAGAAVSAAEVSDADMMRMGKVVAGLQAKLEAALEENRRAAAERARLEAALEASHAGLQACQRSLQERSAAAAEAVAALTENAALLRDKDALLRRMRQWRRPSAY
jgi:chromosome segregation ATPase